MTETQIHKIEQADITIPDLGVGETALVFQRHGKYDRDRDSETAGSLTEQSAADIKAADRQWFKEFLNTPAQREGAYVLFVSSDTQYAGKGHRSLETGQLAQDAAVEVMDELGVDPSEHILNLNADFALARSEETDQDIRPIAGIREPDIFNPADASYLSHLQGMYGFADETAGTGMSPRAWGAHEMDAEKEARLKTDAEGQQDLIDRTKTSLALLERYARIWHASNPGKKLVIWATSHYDTINPLVKEVDGRLYDKSGQLADEYQPVDYGGGIVFKFPHQPEGVATLETRVHNGAPIELGKTATRRPLMRLGLPRH